MKHDPYAVTGMVCRSDGRELVPFNTPRVNLNGNTKESLVEMLVKVKNALEEADQSFVEAFDVCHGRNYQTVPDGKASAEAMRDAWRERRLILQAMTSEIYALAIDISNQ